MSKVTFKADYQGQVTIFPASLQDKLPTNSPARLINQIVDELDISIIIATSINRFRSSNLKTSIHDIVQMTINVWAACGRF